MLIVSPSGAAPHPKEPSLNAASHDEFRREGHVGVEDPTVGYGLDYRHLTIPG